MLPPQPLPDATEILERLRQGATNVESVVGEHLDRLEEYQPHLNAATHILRQEALQAARQPRPGPLSGLPISIKETLGLAGHVITAGSQRMPPLPCAADATVISRLKAAGAIIIARSNVPEFAMTGETTNLRFGRTNNRLDPQRTAGGSSGGEGALVGSGASAAGVGSDILGSIRLPAAFNGVVGFKPASHTIDKTGTWPVVQGYADTFLALGPLTRSVRDARLLYSVIADTPPPPPQPVRGLRLIIPRDFPLTLHSPAIANALTRAQTTLEAAGLRIEEHACADVGQLFLNLLAFISQSFEGVLLRQLATADGQPLRRPVELVRQLIGRPSMDDGLFQMLAVMPIIKGRSSRLPAIIADYEAARRKYYTLLGADGVMLLPTVGLLAPRHGAFNRLSLRPGVNGLVTPLTFPNYLNLPAITQPAWRDVEATTGLPPAVMLCAAPGSEGMLLDVAAVLEPGLTDFPTRKPAQ